jgi:hypothetical protein
MLASEKRGMGADCWFRVGGAAERMLDPFLSTVGPGYLNSTDSKVRGRDDTITFSTQGYRQCRQ